MVIRIRLRSLILVLMMSQLSVNTEVKGHISSGCEVTKVVRDQGRATTNLLLLTCYC